MLPDVFLTVDLKKLLNYKIMVLLGDSNMRAIYKDLVCLAQENSFVSENALKTKMEPSFYGDKLVYSIKKTNARIYKEERIFKKEGIQFEFYFITKVYDEYVERILQHMKQLKPDVVLVSSCLWDITRWGPRGVEKYKENLNIVAELFSKELNPDCLVIWLTALPLSQEMRGGVLVPQLDFLKYSLRYHVMEANQYAQKVFIKNGLDVLDLHYNLQMMIHLRGKDGIHWIAPAVRHQTNLVLTHISLAWGVSLPHRFLRNGENFAIENYDDGDKAAELVRNECQAAVDTREESNNEVSSTKEYTKSNCQVSEQIFNYSNDNSCNAITCNKIFRNNFQHNHESSYLRKVCPSKQNNIVVLPSFSGENNVKSNYNFSHYNAISSRKKKKCVKSRHNDKHRWPTKVKNGVNLSVTVVYT